MSNILDLNYSDNEIKTKTGHFGIRSPFIPNLVETCTTLYKYYEEDDMGKLYLVTTLTGVPEEGLEDLNVQLKLAMGTKVATVEVSTVYRTISGNKGGVKAAEEKEGVYYIVFTLTDVSSENNNRFEGFQTYAWPIINNVAGEKSATITIPHYGTTTTNQ